MILHIRFVDVVEALLHRSITGNPLINTDIQHMKAIISILLVVSGIIVLILGIRKSNQNAKLLGAALIGAGISVNELVQGYIDGYRTAGTQ